MKQKLKHGTWVWIVAFMKVHRVLVLGDHTNYADDCEPGWYQLEGRHVGYTKRKRAKIYCTKLEALQAAYIQADINYEKAYNVMMKALARFCKEQVRCG